MLLVDGLQAGGGAERLATQIAVHLDPERFDRTLCVSRWSPAQMQWPGVRMAREELEEAGVRLLLLERRSTADVLAWRPLWRELRNGAVDVLHAHKFGSNVWAALLGRAARIPVVIAHEHTWSYEGQPLRQFLDRELVARFSDAFVAVSREDRRRMIEIEGVDPGDIVLVPNGVPPAPVGTESDVRAELGIGAEDPVAVCVAVLRQQKAIDVLVHAAAVLARRVPRVKVLVAGPGPAKTELEQLARELGAEHNVMLLGARHDIPALLRAADVAVLSSRYEGSPLTVMEYMQAGLPVVATRVGGVPDLVRDGETGFLVPPEDPDALAGAIERVLADRELAEGLGRRGREVQQEEFTLDRMVGRLEELYERLYAERRAAAPRARAGAAR